MELKEMIVHKTPKEKLNLLRSSAYENYSLSISKVQLILSDKQNWIEDIDSAHYQTKERSEQSNQRHLIYPISLNVILSSCIIVDDPDLPLLKVDAKIPDIQLIVEHQQIVNLVKLLLSIVKVDELAESHLHQHPTKPEKIPAIKSRAHEEIQSNVIRAVAEKQQKQQQILNQVKMQAEFTIQTLLIELKSDKNTIVRGVMNELYTELKIADKNMSVGMNLESIQFFCCMNYYYCINLIQNDVMKQLNDEAPNAIKDLQTVYASTMQQQEKKSSKKEPKTAVVKKSQPFQEQSTIASFNMGKVDFIMLDDFNQVNSPAVIFNLQMQMMYRQHNEQVNVDLRLINIQMAITELASYLKNSFISLFILKPCELTCMVNSKNDDQHISMMIEELALSISPNMVQILMTMIGKLGDPPKIEETDRMKKDPVVNVADFQTAQKIDQNSWYMKLIEKKSDDGRRRSSAGIERGFEDADLDNVSSQASEREERTVKQQMIFQIKTINFVIESGGVSSIPLIKFNSSLLTKFVNYETLTLEMQMFMEYYNEKNFYWEPIFDIIDHQQWEFRVKVELAKKKVAKDQTQTRISLESSHRLEITVSNVALNIFKSLSSSFAKAVNQPEILSKEEQKIIINNSTEMTIFFYIDSAKFSCASKKGKDDSFQQKQIAGQTNLVTLNPYRTLTLLPLSKDAIDYDSVLNYSFVLNGQEANRSMPLVLNDKSVHVIYSNLYPGIQAKYVIDCNSKDKQTRNITFHSSVIVHNYLKIPVGVYKFNTDQDAPEKVCDVNPNGKIYLPIGLVFSNENQYVYIRPTENYFVPVNALIWRFDDLEVKKPGKKSYKTLLCEPINKENDQTVFIRLAHSIERIRFEDCDETDESSQDVLHHFELYPQFVIRNLLPIDLNFRTTNDQAECIMLKPGQDNQVTNARSRNTNIDLDLPDYNDKNWYCFKTNFKWSKEDLTEVWEFKSEAMSGDTLLLAVNFINEDENGFRLLTIFAPFWMINQTGLRLKYNLGDDLYITHETDSSKINLVCFKSKQMTQKKKMQMALENSKFSEDFPVDVVGSKGSIMVELHNKALCFFTIDISLSEVLFTKIVKISAFYTIVSKVPFELEISEDKHRWVQLESQSSQALFPRDNAKAVIHLRLKGNTTSYSKGVSLKCTALTVLEVNEVMVCCQVEVTNHAVLIQVLNYYSGCSPALLVNCLEDTCVDYGQLGEETRLRLPPLSMIHFNWLEPLGFRSLIWSTPQSNEIENLLDKDAFGESLNGGIYWISFYDDNQRILLITKNKKSVNQIFQAGDVLEPDLKMIVNLNGLGLSMVDLNCMKELCYFSISSSDVIWECRKSGSKVFKSFVGKDIDHLEDAYQKYVMKRQAIQQVTDVDGRYEKIGGGLVVNFDQMRMMNPLKGELRRTCLDGLYVNLSKSENLINVHLKMNKIQIDNQLDDHIFATIFCPVPPPKSVRMDLTPKPFIEFSTIIQFNNNRRRFKYFSFLIQEFAVQVDLDFLTALQSYAEVVAKKKETNYEELMNNSMDFAFQSDISLETSSSSKHQYDSIHLSPLKMHLSFSLGTLDTFNLPGILDYLVKSAGVTLIEFKDAVLKINSFMRENTLLTDEEFLNELVGHYKAAALSQFYVIVFGLDVIGNPVGLLLGVTRGVNDLFYEPAMGLIQGPEEFAEGLVLGVRSLFSSTVGGVAGAFGRITGTLGEGISSLMEQSERKKRRERLNKNAGIVQNSKNLAKGFLHGVTGLVSKPMEGVRKEGFEGLIKGVGHGMVGLVAQPTTGIIDFTSGTLNQLQRSVNVSDEVKRIRPARAIHVDGILTSYNTHEALGREMLKNLVNKSSFLSGDIYINHCFIAKDRIFMMTNKHVLFVKNVCMFKTLDVNWYLENSNIDKIEVNDKTVYIHSKKPKKALGLFGEKYVFDLQCESNDIAMWIVRKLRNFIKVDWEF